MLSSPVNIKKFKLSREEHDIRRVMEISNLKAKSDL